MTRRQKRSPRNTTQLSLFSIRLILLTLSILLFSLKARASMMADVKRPKEMTIGKRIEIKKSSQWIHEQFKETEEFYNQRADVLSKKRKKAIAEIEGIIKRARKVNKTILNLRLARLYLEDHYSEIGKAFRIQEMQKKDAEKKGKPVPDLDKTQAMLSLNKSRTLYANLLKNESKHPNRDEMLYYYAITSLNLDQTQEAMATFEDLRTEHPDSRFANDALAQLGDHYFDAAEFDKAETYYQKIINKKHKPLLTYAIYKKAWCAYNTRRIEFALDNFKWVIANEDKVAKNSLLKIKNEALNDVALPFADLKQIGEAMQFYKPFGVAVYRKGIEAIATLLQERGEYEDAVTLWDNLLTLDSKWIKNARYELNVIDSFKNQNEYEKCLDRLFSRIPTYLESSDWYKHNASQAETKQLLTDWEETAQKLTLYLHSVAQQTNSSKFLTLAKLGYTKYLEYFPLSPESTTLRNHLANIQFKDAEYTAAAENYVRVSKDSKDAEIRQNALANAVISYDRELNLERKRNGLTEINGRSNAKVAVEDSEKKPYSETEKRFIELAINYVTQYPQAADSADMAHQAAYLQYLHHDFDKSFESFSELVKAHPKHPTALTASYLMVDMINRRDDLELLVATCKTFLKSGPADKAFRSEIANVLRHAELKRITKLEESEQFEKAGDAYLAYVEEYGSQDKALHEKAIYNSARNYQKGQNFAKATAAQETFLKLFPESKFHKEVLLEVAKSHELYADYTKAASYYQRFAETYPDHSQAKPALRLAGLLYWGAGSAKRSEKAFTAYVEKYPKEKALIDADMLDLAESQGSLAKQMALHRKVLAPDDLPPHLFVVHSLALAEVKARKLGRVPAQSLQKTLAFAEENAKQLRNKPAAMDAFAKLRFWSLLAKETAFNSVKLRLPQERLERSLQKKLELLKEMEAAYTKISKMGSEEWGLGAIYKTALLYQRLSNDVAQSPIPRGLKGKAQDVYRSEIHKSMVVPFRDKALSLAKKCLKQSEELHLYSQWTSQCYTLASQLDAQTYPVVRTFYLPALQVELVVPETSRTEIGSVRSYPYPYFSPLLFSSTDPKVLTNPIDLALRGGNELTDVSDLSRIEPIAFSYKQILAQQRTIVDRTLSSEKPNELTDPGSIAYLNSLRLTSPKNAILAIQQALKSDPTNLGLHNLLGLAYLDSDNFVAAKVTWLAMLARNEAIPAAHNNLGVLAILEGKERQAVRHFQNGKAAGPSAVATTNLAFIALKHHNGAEAAALFGKALEMDKESVTAQIGLIAAELQNRQFETLKEKVGSLSHTHEDPYAALVASYYHIDVARDPAKARDVLAGFLKNTNAEELEQPFKRALDEIAPNAVPAFDATMEAGIR